MRVLAERSHILAKMIIAALLVNYDFKTIEGGMSPRDSQCDAGLVNINLVKGIMIRNRVEW
jgi:hypothetical protein